VRYYIGKLKPHSPIDLEEFREEGIFDEKKEQSYE
jgi:hypothetical protein